LRRKGKKGERRRGKRREKDKDNYKKKRKGKKRKGKERKGKERKGKKISFFPQYHVIVTSLATWYSFSKSGFIILLLAPRRSEILTPRRKEKRKAVWDRFLFFKGMGLPKEMVL